MNTIWTETETEAELKQPNNYTQLDGMPGQEAPALGGVKLINGYACPWAYNASGAIISLPVLFQSSFEKAKDSVVKYLLKVKLIDQEPQPITPAQHESAS